MISFDVTKEQLVVINKIAKRAMRELDMDGLTVNMDLCACISQGNPLRLNDLLNADAFNFAHDIIGIYNHINRDMGVLEDFFLPRFTQSTNVPHP